jgi:hypothetical protein
MLFSPTCCYFRLAERAMPDCRNLLFVTNQYNVETQRDHRQNGYKMGPDEDLQKIFRNQTQHYRK